MESKKILLVGYSGGIGYKTTEILLKEGYSVIGTFSKQSKKENFSGKDF